MGIKREFKLKKLQLLPKSMIKVAYNSSYGGFSVSEKALKLMRQLYPNDTRFGPGDWDNTIKGEKYSDDTICNTGNESYLRDLPRHHPALIQAIEAIGPAANGECAKLKITEIDSNYYLIHEYDGKETIEEYFIPSSVIDGRFI